MKYRLLESEEIVRKGDQLLVYSTGEYGISNNKWMDVNITIGDKVKDNVGHFRRPIKAHRKPKNICSCCGEKLALKCVNKKCDLSEG